MSDGETYVLTVKYNEQILNESGVINMTGKRKL